MPNKNKNMWFEETEQAEEPDMAGCWNYQLRNLNNNKQYAKESNKVGSMEKQLGNVNKEMELPRKNQKGLLEIFKKWNKKWL